MTDRTGKILLRVNKGLALFVFLIFLLGCLPLLGKQAFVQFLPDTDWTEKSNAIAWLVALTATFVAIAMLLIARKLQKSGQSPTPETKGRVQLTLLGQILCAALLMLPSGHLSVTIGIPLVITAVAGQPGQATFVVKRSRQSDGWRCRRPMTFESLPLLANGICDVPQSVRISVFPGSTVELTGRASPLGIFPKKLTKLD